MSRASVRKFGRIWQVTSDSPLTCSNVTVGDFWSGNYDLSTLYVSARPRRRFTKLYLMPASASSFSAQRTSRAFEEDMLYTVGMIFCCLFPSIIITQVDCAQWRVDLSIQESISHSIGG